MVAPRAIFLFLFVCAISASPLSPTRDSFFEEAEYLMTNLHSEQTNITHIRSLLEQSAQQGNPEALCRLGELYLIGLPERSSSSPWSLSHLGTTVHRDFGLALRYFREAFLAGSRNAGFFLSLLSEYSPMFQEFKEFLPWHTSAAQFMIESTKRGSSYSRAAQFSSYARCINSKLFPWLNPKEEYSENDECSSCEDIIFHAYKLAEETVKLVLEKGTVPELPTPLHIDQHIEKSNENKLILYSRMSAESGDSGGFTAIGNNYLHGNLALGIESNPREALKYFQKAAEFNDAQAYEALGSMYLKGQGVTQNTTLAKELLEIAADLGNIRADHTLGKIYRDGLGVARDFKLALQYFETAAANGNSDSVAALGEMYMAGAGVPRDISKALIYFQEAAMKGNLLGLFNIGVMHYKGFVAPKSCATALAIFSEIAKYGYLSEYIRRAYSFYRHSDYEGAFISYLVASSLGYESAHLSLAYMWEKGLVPFRSNFDPLWLSNHFYSKAGLENHSEYAFQKLGDYKYYGVDGAAPDYEEAFQCYRQAVNSPEALFSIAYMQEHGLGVAQDLDAAIEGYTNLVKLANEGKIDENAKHPAQLALTVAKLKSALPLTTFIDFFFAK